MTAPAVTSSVTVASTITVTVGSTTSATLCGNTAAALQKRKYVSAQQNTQTKPELAGRAVTTDIIPGATVTVTPTVYATFTELSTTTITASAPSMVLPSPTPIMVGSDGVDWDEYSLGLQLPFPMTIYEQTTQNLLISIDGVSQVLNLPRALTDKQYLQFITLTYAYQVCDGTAFGFCYYAPFTSDNVQLPQFDAVGGDGEYDPISGDVYYEVQAFSALATMFPLWQALHLNPGTAQGIFYEIDGEPGTRVVTFEFVMDQQTSGDASPAHFTVAYQEAVPNVVEYTYYDVADNGAAATVGAQSMDGTLSQFDE